MWLTIEYAINLAKVQGRSSAEVVDAARRGHLPVDQPGVRRPPMITHQGLNKWSPGRTSR